MMKKKTTDEFIPKALLEVWAAKDAVYRETRNMTPKQQIAYFRKGAVQVAKRIGAKVVKNPDGTSQLV
jgi:hypothetical protein